MTIFKFIEAIKRPYVSVPKLVDEAHVQTKVMWDIHDLVLKQSQNIESLIAAQMALEAGIGHGLEGAEGLEAQALRVAQDSTFGTSIEGVIKSDPVFFKDVLEGATDETKQTGIKMLPSNRRVDLIALLFDAADQTEQTIIFERLMTKEYKKRENINDEKNNSLAS